MKLGKIAAIALICLGLTGFSDARQARSHAERAAFQREQPCPSTGQRRGSCPGYVIDHVQPLCAGGADRLTNMQWQRLDDAAAKDKVERRDCRNIRKGPQ